MMMHSKKELESAYHERLVHYHEVCRRGHALLEYSLLERNIDLMGIHQRVKTFESFYEKISRKQYQEPFSDTEDICGLRVVCYYINDLSTIDAVVRYCFDLNHIVDKTGLMESDRFGYRSNHYIVTLPQKSTRGLVESSTKIEVQVRTILMHTWAHVHGKLEYKQTEHVPQKIRRKIHQLSAMLELVDDQFQLLKTEKDNLRANLMMHPEDFGPHLELNIDTFMSFMEIYFPHKEGSYRYSKLLMVRLMEKQVGFSQLLVCHALLIPFYTEMESDFPLESTREEWLKLILTIGAPNLALFEGDEFLSRQKTMIDKWRQHLKESNND